MLCEGIPFRTSDSGNDLWLYACERKGYPMKKKLLFCLRIGLRFLLLLSVLLLIFIGVNMLLGFERYAVTSPSMRPLIEQGDLIFIREVDPASLQVGDVVTFYQTNSNVVVTHRIVRIDTQSGLLYSKGEQNPDEDGEPVLFENVLGKYVYRLPRLGKLAGI